MKERTSLTWNSVYIQGGNAFKFNLPLIAVGGCEEGLNATTELQEYIITLGNEIQSCSYVIKSSSGSGLDVTITDGTTDSQMCGEHEVLYDTRRFRFKHLSVLGCSQIIVESVLKDHNGSHKTPGNIASRTFFDRSEWYCGFHKLNLGQADDSMLLSTLSL